MDMVLSETMEMAEVFAAIEVNGLTPVDMHRVGWMPCGATDPDEEWPYRCTRQANHGGQHVATAFERVAAVWA